MLDFQKSAPACVGRSRRPLTSTLRLRTGASTLGCPPRWSSAVAQARRGARAARRTASACGQPRASPPPRRASRPPRAPPRSAPARGRRGGRRRGRPGRGGSPHRRRLCGDAPGQEALAEMSRPALSLPGKAGREPGDRPEAGRARGGREGGRGGREKRARGPSETHALALPTRSAPCRRAGESLADSPGDIPPEGTRAVYARVCARVGQTLLSPARGFPRGPKTDRRRRE